VTLAPVLERPASTPRWVTNHGDRVSAYDLRDMRPVGSAGHPFLVPSDLLVTNGLLRFRVGNRGLTPYVSVSVHSTGGAWCEVDCLHLARLHSADTLVGARLVRLTPDVATVALSVRNKGDVFVSLLRGYRGMWVSHGSVRHRVYTDRSVSWGPPPSVVSGTSLETGVFGRSLRTAPTGIAAFFWPPDQSVTNWDIAVWWKPDAASTTQATDGIASTKDFNGGDIDQLFWNDATKTLGWDRPGLTPVLSSAVLSFSAGQPVHVQMRQSATGRTLTVRVGGVTTHTSDTDVSTTPLKYLVAGKSLSSMTTNAYGVGPYGTGPYGGAPQVGSMNDDNSTVDNIMLLADSLTNTEAETLAASTAALGGLPSPQSRLALYLPLDSNLDPAGSALSSGVTYEATTDGGTTAAPDANGLLRGLVGLRNVDRMIGDLGVSLLAERFDVGAFVALGLTTPVGDEVAGLAAQFRSDSEQEVMIR
jgi:hypothetical protein